MTVVCIDCRDKPKRGHYCATCGLIDTRPLRRPGRRARNGHHADCPYPHTDVEHCSICNGIRKGTP